MTAKYYIRLRKTTQDKANTKQDTNKTIINPKNEKNGIKNGIKFVFGLLSIKKAWDEGRKALAV
jgi:hypothetical protein